MANNEKEPSPAPVAFSINAQYIRDLSFEGPAHPNDAAGPTPPQIEVNVSAQTRALDNNIFEVILSTRAQAKMDGKHAFLVELAYAGMVSVPPGLPDEALRYLLLVEAPRQLFPFARAIIANATREGGFPPLLLQPIDFNALYQQQMTSVAAPAAGST
jgi:preprotein translocase subunit SecB